jgi:probable FeS assembly SUF system protein SufT
MSRYSQTSEPVRFERDCAAIMVPSGDLVNLPAGQTGYITQALGGSFTVFVEGNLFRIKNEDADAIGKEPMPLPELPDNASDDEIEQAVWSQLRTCFDPEIPINIVELGLVYRCEIAKSDDGKRRAEVQMTLTAPGCGMGQVLKDDVESKVRAVPGVIDAQVELTFEPPWGPDRMTEEAQLELGFY